MQDVLTHFGAGIADIVDETVLVTQLDALMGSIDEVHGVREAAYGSSPEMSQTVVQVAALINPGLKIETKCIADRS